MVEIYGGAYGKDVGLIKVDMEDLGVYGPDSNDYDDRDMAEAMVCDRIMGAMMLNVADYVQYVMIKDNLANHCTIGKDNYTTKMEKCMHILNNYKSEKNKHASNSFNQYEMTFVQDKYRHKY